MHVAITGQDTLNTRRTLNVGGKEFEYFSFKAAEEAGTEAEAAGEGTAREEGAPATTAGGVPPQISHEGAQGREQSSCSEAN